MKIFVSHSREIDFINDLYNPITNSDLAKEHQFYFPHDNNKSVNTKDIIRNSDLVLAEVSKPATGQGIELGWAESFGVPIICISREGEKTSGSLKYLTDKFGTYKDVGGIVEVIKSSI